MSPQPCSVCEHVERAAIDEALAAGESGRSVAARYELTEASTRRHRAAHLPQRRDEMAPGSPTTPASAPSLQESPRIAAERLLEAEEAEERERRLAELERGEQARRDREHRAREQAAALEAARVEAEELRERRVELADRAEEQCAAFMRTLNELEALDRHHAGLLSRFNILPHGYQPVRRVVGRWLQVALGNFSPAGPVTAAADPHHGARLRDRDRLAKPLS